MGEQIHVTERQDFKFCRRLWSYKYLEHLQKAVEPHNALWLGRALHYGLTAYYTLKMSGGCTKEEGVQAALQNFHNWLDQKIPRDEVEKFWPEELRQYEETINLVETMLRGYVYMYHDQDDFDEILGVEIPLVQRIPGTYNYLVGTLDLLVRKKGKLWVVDHKNVSSFVDPEMLELDDQMTAYLWLVWKTFKELPQGAIYNQLRKKVPSEPRLLVSGKGLSKDLSIDTTYEKYLEALQKYGFSPDEYSTILEKLKYNKFYHREYVARNPAELLTFEKNLVEESRDMIRLKRLYSRGQLLPYQVYPSPCKECTWTCSEFKVLCKTQNEGGDVEVLKQTLYIVSDERRL